MSNDKTLELQIRIAAQEAFQAVSSLKGEISSLAVEAEKFAKTDGAALNKSFKDAETAAKDTVSGIGEIKKAIVSLAEVAAAAKALSVVKDMGTFALQAADSFQTARNQFGVLLGDMKAGAGLFNEIKAFNDKTPFNLDTLTQATNVLIAAKVPLQELQAQLTKFGDLSQGNSQKLTSYVNAFSQAAAKGKADMQVLNTYLHQGVPILDALAKNFGVTTAEIVEMSSQGQISFADFSRALDDLTSAGGRYFGGMELASKSLAAMQEGLKESVNSLAASYGEMLLPAAIAVVSALTAITNAINESPLGKGLFAGAIAGITAGLAVMAVKAGIAFAAQMKLNLAVGVLRPEVLAATIIVAALATGYTILSADAQKAARETDNLARAQRGLNDAVKKGPTAVQEFYEASKKFDYAAALWHVKRLQAAVDEQRRNGITWKNDVVDDLKSATDRFIELRDDFIKEFYDASTDDKIKTLRDRISVAQTYMVTVDISGEDRGKLEKIIADAREEITELLGDIDKKAAAWKEDWAGVWNKFQAEQAHDPFYEIELEREKKLKDALKNGVHEDAEAIKQVNAYYNAQRSEVIRQLAEEEARIQRELSQSKIDDLQHELQEALRAINTLEAQRIIAAAGSEEEIARIRERYEGMRETTRLQFDVEINAAKLEEARDAVKNWQEELSDSLLLAIMNLEIFSEQASVILNDLSSQLIQLSVSAALSGFEQFGRALGEGQDAAESMSRALAEMSQQILQQLPMMFLQAGLQLIANGQWPLGLGFIAAAGSSAIISGYVDGASKHAQGGVFDEYGKAARAFTAGGVFTNQIVSTPTYFQHGGGLGLMGEAGPEAIMPLTRMPNGDLGIQTAGGGAQVIVKIINNSGEAVQKEERTDAEGNKQIDVIIGQLVNNHITSGKADRAMSRYGLRAAGV
ncbi:MAG: tape measure protein [Treponema sp.]|jgi:tape measure domain-containing protein|nr:tape measure protein [Treponema sp.]